MTRARSSRTQGATRVLPLVALILVVSALLRLATGPVAAVALDMAEPDPSTPTAPPVSEDQIPEIAALLERLRTRDAELDAREAKLDAREAALGLVEARVNDNLARLEEAERALAATMMRAETASENDLTRLTGVYESMKPEQAAELFKRMEPSFAAGFLGRMRTDAAAQIMAGLDPDLAYSISAVLAGRNADVPVEAVPEEMRPPTSD